MSSDIHIIFSRNLNTILDIRKHPTSGYGRVKRLAEMFNISAPSAQKWLNDGSIPDPSRYHEITAKLGCTLDALFSRDGPIASIEQNHFFITTLTDFGSFKMQWPTPVVESLRWDSGVMLMRVLDNAMEPYTVLGDYVAFNPNMFNFAGDGIYVIYANGKYSIRRISQLSTGNFRLYSSETRVQQSEDINSSSVIFGLPTEVLTQNFYIVGPVVGRLLVHR